MKSNSRAPVFEMNRKEKEMLTLTFVKRGTGYCIKDITDFFHFWGPLFHLCKYGNPRKSHTGYLLVLKLVTFNGLKWRNGCYLLFHQIWNIYDTVRPILSATEM